jgi:DNA ligase D-like protein (predicted polymerase)
MPAGDEREGIVLTNLDQPLFDGADATKADLVDYLDTMADRIVPVLAGRPLSVIRVRPGQAPFMQKNVAGRAPDWLPTVVEWAHSSQRDVAYALCNDRRTLLWFANQRAVEYHPALTTVSQPEAVTHLVVDLDPPEGAGFGQVVAVAGLVRAVLDDAGLAGVAKTSGAKGLHVFVPLAPSVAMDDAAAALRALAARVQRLDPALATTAFLREDRGGRVFVDPTRVGGATVVAAYSPRVRPGCTVSFPLRWDDLGAVVPRELTIRTVPAVLAGANPWAELMPAAQTLPADLVAEGATIPVPRVAAMHEGRRRARSRRS